MDRRPEGGRVLRRAAPSIMKTIISQLATRHVAREAKSKIGTPSTKWHSYSFGPACHGCICQPIDTTKVPAKRRKQPPGQTLMPLPLRPLQIKCGATLLLPRNRLCRNLQSPRDRLSQTTLGQKVHEGRTKVAAVHTGRRKEPHSGCHDPQGLAGPESQPQESQPQMH